jgi:putative colanic acid biosynthesis UDP-glucose lipid carrier transferase
LDSVDTEFVSANVLVTKASFGVVESMTSIDTHLFEQPAFPCQGFSRSLKHGFDRVVALLLLMVFALPLLVIAGLIRLDSPGSPFFLQRRTGVDGRVFTIFKFRTMTQSASRSTTIVQAQHNDPRVTRIGRFLRKTSLDELPQLLNVLLGDMSLVGPRPHAVEHDIYYGNLIARYQDRHLMRPGVTGLAQLNGLRGETSTVDAMHSRVMADLDYIETWSFWLDLKILALTPISCVAAALKGRAC